MLAGQRVAVDPGWRARGHGPGDGGVRTEITQRLVAHAAGAKAYVEAPDMVPVVVTVRWLKVVEVREGPHLLLTFDV